jgi:hypothetical protein
VTRASKRIFGQLEEFAILFASPTNFLGASALVPMLYQKAP